MLLMLIYIYIYIYITMPRHFLYLVYLCSCLDPSVMSYLWTFFINFIFIFIIIMLNMPQVLNMSRFWIYLWFWKHKGSGYARFLNIPLVLNMPAFWIYPGSEFARITQGSGYAWLCLDMSEYGTICGIMHKSTWTASAFHLHFHFISTLSTWMCGFLFQCLLDTRSYSLKEHYAVFFKIQNLICSTVTRCIYLFLVFN